MKIAVMGAGAVGCYYGGMLARAGHSVVLIGRAQHVDVIRRDGLLMDTQTFREPVLLLASTEASAVAGTQLVLCCVKSGDTEVAAAQMKPYLSTDTVVLSLQNGVDNAERLQATLGHPVFPAVVYVAVEMAGSGQVRHLGRGELVVGPAVLDSETIREFGDAGVPVQLSDNVEGALWAKLILNCAYNALSAITQVPYGALFQSTGIESVMRDVVRECLAVADAAGIRLPGDVWASIEQIARSMPGQLSSTAQDLARGKPGEIDYLNGYVVRLGDSLGVPVPVNRVLHTLVKVLENK